MYNVTFGINLYTCSLIRQHKLSKLHINNRYINTRRIREKGEEKWFKRGWFKKV